jgi:outer membrane protein TolC
MKKIIGVLLFVFATGHAQTNLDYFLQTAETNNPLLKEYTNQISASALQRDLIRSQQILPQISLSAGYLFAPFFNNNGHLISTTPEVQAIGYDIGITNGGLYSAQINVEKNIFNGGTADALSAAQSIQEDALRNTTALTKRDLARQVTDQYLQAYHSRKLYELSRETSANIKALLSILEKLVAQGAAKQSEYLLLSIEYESKMAAAADSYVQFTTNRNQLCSLCGITDSAAVPIDSVDMTLRTDRPRFEFVKKFEYDSLSARSQQEQFENKYRPQVSVFFTTGLNAVELNTIHRKFGLSAGVNFSLPLFDGNQRSITRQQNQLSLQSIANYRATYVVQLDNQRKNTLDRLENLRSILQSYARQVAGYEQVLRIAENELRRGQVTMVEYLTLLSNYIEVRKNRISAETEMQREINNYNYWN